MKNLAFQSLAEPTMVLFRYTEQIVVIFLQFTDTIFANEINTFP